MSYLSLRAQTILAAVVLGMTGTGCHTTCKGYAPPLFHPCAPVPEIPGQPRESAKVVYSDYIIEPPDVLLIDAVRVVPRPPYHIEPLDTLAILVTETLPQQPIQGLYAVEPEGTINLGF